MNQALFETAVRFLGFSGDSNCQIVVFKQSSSSQWEKCIRRLHSAGIALYFLQKLKQTGGVDALPRFVYDHLERSLAANRERIENLARQFQLVNQLFDERGVKYAAIKGFALVPLYCPDMVLRPLGDFDYLVDEDSVPAAQEAIEQNGYFLQSSTPTEFKFLGSWLGPPPYLHEQYNVRSPHAVELHLSLWDSKKHGMELAEPRLSGANVAIHEFQGASFPTLRMDQAFVLQAVHAFHHILTYWVRMSWFYEMAFFLNQQANNDALWAGVEQQVREDSVLREVVALVAELTARFFGAPLPPKVAAWTREIRPAVRVWIENYARVWFFGKNRPTEFSLFPTAKLVLFLHQQYARDGNLLRRRLLPLKHFAPAEDQAHEEKEVSKSHAVRPGIQVRNAFFHAGAGLRYLWEMARWYRLN